MSVSSRKDGFKGMHEGKIIEYIDHGSFICTLCLADKGNRLHLLTPTNRELNLPVKRAALISQKAVNTTRPRGDLLSLLKQTEVQRMDLQAQIEVEELWELIREEGQSFDYRYLAQLCFGEEVADDHISALVRALFRDKLYFKMKEGRFLPNSELRVEQILAQREEEERKEVRLRKGSEWLRDALKRDDAGEMAGDEHVTNLLIELAVFGNDAPNFKEAKEMLSRAGITDTGEARRLLLRFGIWEEDENLDLFRFDIKTDFGDSLLLECERLADSEINGSNRIDLRELRTFTIDGPLTRDFDDALSVEIEGHSIKLGIHIADVASVIPQNSILYKEASQRGASLYLPRHQIPMLPPRLSQDTLSLKKGCDRPAISMLARFDEQGNLLEHRFMPSLIRVRQQLTYDQVNNLCLQHDYLERLVNLSRMMRKKRIEGNALILSVPELIIKTDEEGTIKLELLSQETPSRMMVAEFMIFYNWMAARFCRENGIPVLYRSQGEPNERLSIGEAGYIFYVFKQRSKLTPLLINSEPRPHTSIGLDAYTNVTSPIRRYLDLVVQRQIKDFLLDNPLTYNDESLENVRMSVETVLKDIERVKRSRIRYWTQKYLGQHSGKAFPALVLTVMRNKYRILLTDCLLVAEMKRETGQTLKEGQHLLIRVIKSDPWNDVLRLEYVG